MNAAIYQWFDSGGEFLNYEHFIFLSAVYGGIVYYGYDFDTHNYRRFGHAPSSALTLASDDKNVFTPSLSGGKYGLIQIHWRGHCFHNIGHADLPGGYNSVVDMVPFRNLEYLGVVGVRAFGHEASFSAYDPNNDPITWGTVSNITSTLDYWGRCWNVPEVDDDPHEFGSAMLVAGTFIGQDFATINYNGASWLKDTSYSGGNKANPLFNPFTKIITSVNGNSGRPINEANGNPITNLQIEDDLSITGAGSINAEDTPRAAITTRHGHILTAELVVNDTYVRCYDDTGTKLDEIKYTNQPITVYRTLFNISPRTGRIWLFGSNSSMGLRAYDVDEAGQITEDAHIPGEAAVTSGGASQALLVFLEQDLEITTNGYTGIKEKLFECWEMNETSGTRAGSMSELDIGNLAGTPGYRTGKHGNAVDFDGTNSLGSYNYPSFELQSGSNFSICLDFITDSLAAQQCIFFKGRWNAAVGGHRDCGAYIDTSGNVSFWLEYWDSGSVYRKTVTVSSVTVAIGTWYNLYCEFDAETNTLSARIDNGTVHSDTIPANATLNVYSGLNTDATLHIGQYTTWNGNTQYMDGGLDNFYWFYDVLTSAEQSWMYNGGASRQFSEL